MTKLFTDIMKFQEKIEDLDFIFPKINAYREEVVYNPSRPFALKTSFDRKIENDNSETYFLPSARVVATLGNSGPNNIDVWLRLKNSHLLSLDTLEGVRTSVGNLDMAAKVFGKLYKSAEKHPVTISTNNLMQQFSVGIATVDEYYKILENVVACCTANSK